MGKKTQEDKEARKAIKGVYGCLFSAARRLPLLLSYLGRIPIRLMPNEYGPLAAVDGQCLYINQPRWESLERKHKETVVAHEALHLILAHIQRRGNRQPRRWNYACDAVINRILINAGFSLPYPCVPPASAEVSAEEYYERLKCEDDRLVPIPAVVTDIADLHEAGIAEEVEAEEGGDDRGTGRGVATPLQGAEHEAELLGIAATTLLTRALPGLRRAIAAFAGKCDYGWQKPRQYGQIILPTVEPRRPRVVIALDASGSVREVWLRSYCHTAGEIAQAAGCNVDLVFFDWDVRTAVMDATPPFGRYAVYPGGGTNYRAAFNWVQENRPGEAVLLVYFTDGRCPDRICETELINLVWVIHPRPLGAHLYHYGPWNRCEGEVIFC